MRCARELRYCCGLEKKTEEELLSCGLGRGKEELVASDGWWGMDLKGGEKEEVAAAMDLMGGGDGGEGAAAGGWI